MHPAYIQAELKRRGITQRSIAAELGVTAVAVTQVIHKRSRSERVMEAISKKIGIETAEVFPEFFPRKRPAT